MSPREPDRSVLTALAELRALEEQRIADEHAEAARRLSEQHAQEARARADAEEARRRAEAAAQRRDDDDALARDAEAARRVAALRAELDAVQADRARLHGAMLAAAHDAPTPTAGGMRGATALFAGCALLAAGVAVGLALRPATGSGVVPTAAVESVSATRESATALPAAGADSAAVAGSADSRDAVSVDREREARGEEGISDGMREREPRASLAERRNLRQRELRERELRERGDGERGRGDGRGGGRGGGHGDGLEADCDEDDPTCGM